MVETNAAGKVVSVEDVGKASTPTNPETGLKAMTAGQVREYLTRLAQGAVVGINGMEKDVAQRVTALAREQLVTESQCKQAQQAFEQLTDKLSKVRGQIAAYSELLVTAEDERRFQNKGGENV